MDRDLHAEPDAAVTAPVIEVRDLVKTYGDLNAVDGVSFSIEPGEVFALLGPNGAGKSTTIEILEGHRERTSGEVTVLGFDPGRAGRDFRNRIGIVLQSSGIEDELTVREAIDHYRAAYTNPRPTGEVIELVEMADKADARLKTLSGGQVRRVDLALGLVGDPDLLFLDEPTTGFDPSARRRSWRLIDNLRTLGKTILLTTHYMDEAQQLADRVAVISGGRIVAEGTPDSLGHRDDADSIIRFRLPATDVPIASLLEPLVGKSVGRNSMIEVSTPDPTRDLHTLTGWALEHGVELGGLTVSRPTLEDIYLQLTGEEAAS